MTAILCRSCCAVAAVITLLYGSDVHAQVNSPERFAGEWSGTLVTDALRGVVQHTITGSIPRLTIATTVTARARTLRGQGDSVTVRGDTLRFGVTIDGARLRWVAIARRDTLAGTIRVTQGTALAASGVWEAARIRGKGAIAPVDSSALSVFDATWSAIDRGYGNFAESRLDWMTVRRVFRPRAASAPNDSALFAVLADMLGVLNDAHVTLRHETLRFSGGGRPLTPTGDFSIDVIAQRYVGREMHTALSGTIRYGWLADSIGYLYLSEFGPTRDVSAVLDSAFAEFTESHGLVIDIRDNRGGNDVTGQRLLNLIADERRLYMTTSARALSDHGSFLPPHPFYLAPADDRPFRTPVAVLTNRRTVSAGENFLLGVRTLPHASIVGDVTAGAFADVTRETLPNGWILGYPINHVLDARGRSGEGVGLSPDYRRTNAPAEILMGKDAVLEFALALLAAQRAR